MNFKYKSNSLEASNFGNPRNNHNALFRLCLYDTLIPVVDEVKPYLSAGFEISSQDQSVRESWQLDGDVWYFRPSDGESSDGIQSVRLDPVQKLIRVSGRGPALPLARVRTPENPARSFQVRKGFIAQFHSVATSKCWSTKFYTRHITTNNKNAFRAATGQWRKVFGSPDASITATFKLVHVSDASGHTTAPLCNDTHCCLLCSS